MSIRILSFDSVGIQLGLEVENECVLGIRQVIWRGLPLRDPREPIQPLIVTADGWWVERYEFRGIETLPGGALVIQTVPRFRTAPQMVWTDSALHPRVNTGGWGGYRPVGNARMDWILRPCRQTLGGVAYEGFSYGFRYHAPGCSIFQIHDRASWELGGEADGNTFIMRNFFAAPVQRLDRTTAYDSGWTVRGLPNPYLFQHLPLYAQLQGFTFQVSADAMLTTVHDRPSHVRSLFHKEANDTLLLHFHQFCFDLTDSVATPERRILVARRPEGGETAVWNHFLDLRRDIQSDLRAQAGVLRFDIPRPSAHVETWEVARLERLPAIWKALYEWHIHRAYLMPLWRSIETDVIPRFAHDQTSFNFLGNMCCPLELEIADVYGGWEGLKRAMKAAVDLEVDVVMWCGSHFSSLSPLERAIPGLFVRDVSGQPDRSQYGHLLFVANQRNRAYQDYLISRLERLKECGVSGVYRDSHFTMCCDTFHHAHDDRGSWVYTMHEDELAIQRRVQEDLGLLYYVDGGGIFGTPLVGTAYDLIHGLEPFYQDVETADLDLRQVQANGRDPFEAYFRGMSCRLFYQVNVEVNRFPASGSLSAWWQPDRFAALLEGYARVEPHMGSMHLLEEDGGTEWRDPLGHRVIFPWKRLPVSCLCPDGRRVTDVVACARLSAEEAMEPGHIYFVENPAGKRR